MIYTKLSCTCFAEKARQISNPYWAYLGIIDTYPIQAIVSGTSTNPVHRNRTNLCPKTQGKRYKTH